MSSKLLKFGLPVLVISIIGFFLLRFLVERASPMPENLGVDNGRLAPCPDSPNCVSSQADDEQHGMAPLPLSDSVDDARQELVDIVQGMPRSRIITADGNYIHAEFRSPTWAFIDDVEFYIDEEAGLIHFRSAARLGESDLGANRSRMEEITQQFNE